MNLGRREFLAGVAATAVAGPAAAVEGPKIVGRDWPYRVIPLERHWTHYKLRTCTNGWWSTEMGVVSHLPDLSDLGEPYLSAVKEALREKQRRATLAA